MKRRRAFTLLEVIAALGLSVLLMAAVYAAIELYWRYSITGREQVERAQIARTVLRRMRIDVQSMVYRPADPDAVSGSDTPAASGTSASNSGGTTSGGASNSGTTGNSSSGNSSGGNSSSGNKTSGSSGSNSNTSGGSGSSSGNKSSGGSSGTSSNSSGSGSNSGSTSGTNSGSNTGAAAQGTNSNSSGVTVEDPTQAMAATTVGLVGSPTTLLIHVTRPPREAGFALMDGANSLSSRTSDLLSVSYFVAAKNATGLPAMVATLATQKTGATTADGITGLACVAGDRTALESSSSGSNQELMAEAAQILAPEISSLQFRYHDGQQWQTAWDSTTVGRLPIAIEVTLGFRDRASLLGKTSSRGSSALGDPLAPVQIIRHVIAVPLVQLNAETYSSAAADGTRSDGSTGSGSTSGGSTKTGSSTGGR